MKVIHIDTHEKELRKVSEPISLSEINTPEFNIFLEELYEAMLAEPMKEGWMAAGISAVQVGIHKQVFYAYDGNSDKYFIVINPQIEYMGEVQDIKIESCLSIPEVVGAVRRHKRIKLRYIDEKGKRQRKTMTGWNARVVQHEVDHLNGVLFIDKISEEDESVDYA